MQLIINLPSRDETLTFLRQRWEEAVRDPHWSQVEGKFETNSFGQLIVNPPPTFFHNDRAYRIAALLEKNLGGYGRTEVPVLTVDGIKVPDAVWLSPEKYETARGQSALDSAPEICVEVLSPSNTDAEMQHKRFLYFDAGAIECWECDEQGHMSYYDRQQPDARRDQSKLCKDFTNIIND